LPLAKLKAEGLLCEKDVTANNPAKNNVRSNFFVKYP
jgi:hypothetical protein